MGKILVTGGAGFIGFDFAKLLLDRNISFVVVDKLTYAANKEAETFFSKKYIPFFKIDITEIDQEFIEENDIDTIVNFAAETHVDNSIKSPGVFVKTNINGTFNLLQLSRDNELRYHQISTDEVYGDLPIDKPEWKFNVDSPLKPSSPYSASKASADLLVNSYVRTFGLKATISRCSNNYGPFQNSEKFIPTIIKTILNNGKVPVYGDGKNIRDWIYVRDHNEAVLKIITEVEDGTFNIGANNEISNLDILRTITEVLGVKFEDSFKFVKDRLGHDRRYAINPNSMKEIGWIPKVSFIEGIKETVEFYEQN